MRRALLALGVSWAALLLLDPWADERVSDLFLYRSITSLVFDGALPFRDFDLEYPPLAAPVIVVGGLFGTGEDAFRLTFAAAMLAAAAATALLCGALAERTGGDRRRAMLAAALAPLLLGAVLRTHFDLVPVALTLGALAALTSGRVRTAFALIGVGAALKAFPLVVAPVALAWLLGAGRRREALEGLAALGIVLAVAGAAWLGLSADGAADSVRYHLDRPIQVESLPAMALGALDGVGLGEVRSVHSHRSDGLTHPAGGAVSAALLVLLAAVLAALCAAAARAGPDDARAVVLGSLTAVCACVALGKVLSPQFLAWAIPVGALAVAWRMPALALASAATLALTLAEFPSRYFDVVQREPLALGLVAARDFALLVLVALGLGAVSSREPGAAGWRWRGRRRPPRQGPRSATGPRPRSRTA